MSELVLFGAGVWLYRRTTEAVDRVGSVALWALVVFLLVAYGASLFSPPPSPSAVGWMALSSWLIVPWAYWIDRHRRLRA